MDQAFANALRLMRHRHRAYGLTLRPLTVGHLFLLLEMENAYPDHPEEAGYPDLMSAVLVCSQGHARARKLIESAQRAIGRGRQVWWMRLWGWLVAKLKMDWKAEAVRFGEYLREHLRRPQADELGGGGEATAPLAWRLQAMLMHEFHMTPAETLDCPVGWAITLWATEADRRGVGKLASTRQVRFRDWVAEMERKRLEAEAAENAANYAADEGKCSPHGPLEGENAS